MPIGRRRLLAAMGATALVVPLAAFGQPSPRVARIGRLSPLTAGIEARNRDAILKGLLDLGWIEKRNLIVESRFADGDFDRLPRLAAELVALKVDVIIAGSTPGALAARNATSTIPIVMVTTGDPVVNGLVKSLARPGGNVTGMTALTQELGGKRLELFKEALPGLNRIAVLANPASPDTKPSWQGVSATARALGITLNLFEARNAGEIDSAFAQVVKQHAKALMVLQDAMFTTHQKRIVELATEHRLPAMYALQDFVNAGGLMFYGVDLPHMYRSAASHVDKILKGSRPADIPVEQPTKLELVINMKAAKALGIKFSNSLLMRAKKVIE